MKPGQAHQNSPASTSPVPSSPERSWPGKLASDDGSGDDLLLVEIAGDVVHAIDIAYATSPDGALDPQEQLRVVAEAVKPHLDYAQERAKRDVLRTDAETLELYRTLLDQSEDKRDAVWRDFELAEWTVRELMNYVAPLMGVSIDELRERVFAEVLAEGRRRETARSKERKTVRSLLDYYRRLNR